MKFTVQYTDHTIITAFPENDMELFGLRAQGPYTTFVLKDRELHIDYVPKNIHPDILAAICLTAFYPFIKYSATMPLPVSPVFASGLQMDILPQHDLIDGVYRAVKPITISNIDENLQPYQSGTETVIAFGGGADSSAVGCLYPEFPLIHTSNYKDREDSKVHMRNYIKDNFANELHMIDTNCKELTVPNGFTTFTNIFIVPLIMMNDLKIKNICCGEILQSACLSNGKKYFPQFNPKNRNRWIRFYQHIGVNIFSPVAGCSELITCKIIHQHGLSDKVLFCEMNNGKPCFKCSKCFRKITTLKYHGYEFDCNTFDPEVISTFLSKRPLYFANQFIECIKNLDDLPDIYRNTISDIIDTPTEYYNRIYTKSFVYFPEEIKDHLIERLTKYADFMTQDEEKAVEKWDMTKI